MQRSKTVGVQSSSATLRHASIARKKERKRADAVVFFSLWSEWRAPSGDDLTTCCVTPFTSLLPYCPAGWLYLGFVHIVMKEHPNERRHQSIRNPYILAKCISHLWPLSSCTPLMPLLGMRVTLRRYAMLSKLT